MQEDLEVGPGGYEFLDAQDGDQHLRQRQAHPPVALGLQHDDRPGIGDGEVAAGHRDGGAQELLPQVQPGRLGQLRRGVADPVRCRPAHLTHLLDEDVADLRAVAVDRRYQDVRGQVVPELHDQLGEIGLPYVDALLGQRVVELDLLGGHRLDLDHLAGVVRLDDVGDDRVGLCRVDRPVHHAAGRGDPLLQLLQQFGQAGEDGVLDRRAGQPQVFPVGQLSDRAQSLVPDRHGGPGEVGPLLGIGERRPRGDRERRHPEERRMAHRASAFVEARISARCSTRTGAPWRDSSPPMCIRQDVSAEVSTSAPVASTSATLSCPMAVEVSGFLTLNVPPKPQHSCGCVSGRSSMPSTAASSRCGRSPMCSSRSE